MSWMSYECKQKETSRPGYRPDFLKALEFTEDLWPHLHVLFFGVPTRNGTPHLIDKQELSDRWDSLGQGMIVDIQGLEHRDDLDSRYRADAGFVNLTESARLDAGEPPLLADGGSGGVSGCTAGAYLAKYLSGTFSGLRRLSSAAGSDALARDFVPVSDASDGAESSGSDAGADADGDASESAPKGSELSKLAVYWASGRRIWTVSRDIERAIEPDEPDVDEDDVRIRFLGCYPFWDLPLSTVSGAVAVDTLTPETAAAAMPATATGSSPTGDRPPPAEARSVSASSAAPGPSTP